MMKKQITFFGLCCVFAATTFAFEPTVELEGQTLTLVGTGTLKYKGLIKVYDAALYLPEQTKTTEILSNDVPRCLAVKYHVDAKQERFHKAGRKVLDDSFTAAELAEIDERLTKINGWYDDAKEDETCAIWFDPKKGTRLTVNGEERGWIAGNDFAKRYFSIWFGDPCASKSLKKGLLGEK